MASDDLKRKVCLFDFKNRCCVCYISRSKDTVLFNLQRCYFGKDSFLSILQMFNKHFQDDHKYPQNICFSCIKIILQVVRFLEQIRNAIKMYDKILSSKSGFCAWNENCYPLNLNDIDSLLSCCSLEDSAEINENNGPRSNEKKHNEDKDSRDVTANESSSNNGKENKCVFGLGNSMDQLNGKITSGQMEMTDQSIQNNNCYLDFAQYIHSDIFTNNSKCSSNHEETDENENGQINVRFLKIPYSIDLHDRSSVIDFESDIEDLKDFKLRKMVFQTSTSRYKCNVCSQVYTNVEDLRIHRNSRHYKKHNKRQRVCHIFRCDPCSLTFLTKYHLLRHKRAHRKVQCQICRKTYQLDHLGRHFKTHRRNWKHQRRVINQFEKMLCSKCGKIVTINNMRYHLSCSENQRTTTFNCDKCPFITRLHTSMVRHKRKHATDLRFNCTFCDYSAIQEIGLEKHISEWHKELPNDKLFLCICNKQFQFKYDMWKHMKAFDTGERFLSHAELHGFSSEEIDLSLSSIRQTETPSEMPPIQGAASSLSRILSDSFIEHQDQLNYIKDEPDVSMDESTIPEEGSLDFFQELSGNSAELLDQFEPTKDEPNSFGGDVVIKEEDIQNALEALEQFPDMPFPNSENQNESQTVTSDLKVTTTNDRNSQLVADNAEVDYSEHYFSSHGGYKCCECFVWERREDRIMEHVDIHLGRKGNKCNLCPSGFKRRYDLKVHINSVHFKMRRHKCLICEKTFTTKSTLKDHIRKHTGERLPCPHCSQHFRCSSSFYKHLRAQHKISKNTHAQRNAKSAPSHVTREFAQELRTRRSENTAVERREKLFSTWKRTIVINSPSVSPQTYYKQLKEELKNSKNIRTEKKTYKRRDKLKTVSEAGSKLSPPMKRFNTKSPNVIQQMKEIKAVSDNHAPKRCSDPGEKNVRRYSLRDKEKHVLNRYKGVVQTIPPEILEIPQETLGMSSKSTDQNITDIIEKESAVEVPLMLRRSSRRRFHDK